MRDKDYTYNYTSNGADMQANVSPCVWMYPGYPLQLQITLGDKGGAAYAVDRQHTWETATEEDVRRLAETVKVCQCTRCGKPAFDPTSVDTNRAGLCEECFIHDLTANNAADIARYAQEQKKEGLHMKRKGYTHRVSAMVHPTHGDDREVVIYYSASPSKGSIQSALRRAGSEVLTDYVVTAL